MVEDKPLVQFLVSLRRSSLIRPMDFYGRPLDLTGLLEALVTERNAWRASNGVYDVATMLAHGNVVTELEKVIDFD